MYDASNNFIKLFGQVCSPILSINPELNSFYVNVKRHDKEVVDRIYCVANPRVLSDMKVEVHDFVSINGEIHALMRYYEKKKESRLFVSAYADDISNVTKQIGNYEHRGDANFSMIKGYICKIHRGLSPTGKGRKIVDFSVAVPNMIKHNDKDETAYIPCFAFDKLAERIENCKIGDKVLCKGRMLERQYYKQGIIDERHKREVNELMIFNFYKYDENNFNQNKSR